MMRYRVRFEMKSGAKHDAYVSDWDAVHRRFRLRDMPHSAYAIPWMLECVRMGTDRAIVIDMTCVAVLELLGEGDR